MLCNTALVEGTGQNSSVLAYCTFNSFWGENPPTSVMRVVYNTCRDMLLSHTSRLTVSPNHLPDTYRGEPRGPTQSIYLLIKSSFSRRARRGARDYIWNS